MDRVVHHAVILELPIPSYRAQAANARSQAPAGAATPDPKSVEDMHGTTSIPWFSLCEGGVFFVTLKGLPIRRLVAGVTSISMVPKPGFEPGHP